MATLQEAIDRARADLQDTNAIRWSDADLVQYGNDAFDAICEQRPELFYSIDEITCIDGAVIQTLRPQDSHGIVDILFVKDGPAVLETTRETLAKFNPNWQTDTAAPAQNWMRLGDDPFRFLIYPKAPTGQVLLCEHISIPVDYPADATHQLPETYTHIIADYIVHRAYRRDTKDQNIALSTTYLQSFLSKLGITDATNVAERKDTNKGK